MKEGLSLVAPVGYHQIIIEWDCLQVVQAFTRGNTWWNEGSRIIADSFDLVLEIGTAHFLTVLGKPMVSHMRSLEIAMRIIYLVFGLITPLLSFMYPL